MGLVQRKIEQAGFSTITISNIPDLTAAVSPPRVAGIEYPFGQTLGKPGDADGQRAVLQAALQALQEIQVPGEAAALPFEWPEDPHRVDVHPPEPPPIADHLKRNLRQIRWLLNRQVPK